MKKVLLISAVAISATLGGCCSAQQEDPQPSVKKETATPKNTPEPSTPDPQPAAQLPTKEDKAEPPAQVAKEPAADAVKETSDGENPIEVAQDPKEESPKAAEDAQQAQQANQGEEAPAKEASAQKDPNAADQAPNQPQEAAAQPVNEASAGQDPEPNDGVDPDEERFDGPKVEDVEPFKPGEEYKGPPSQAIVGTWRITVPKSSVPRGLPADERRKLRNMGEVTMTFDGEKAVVRAGKDEESFTYEVSNEKEISMRLTAKRGALGELITVTFYDMDNIMISEPRYPGPARGARVKEDAP